MTVRPVPDFVEIGIERAGRDFMQQRLPDVGAMTVDEENVDVGVAPVSASQFRGKLQASGASPDNDDLRHSIRHVTTVACPGVSTRDERRRSGIDRDSLRRQVERETVAIMRHEAEARRLDVRTNASAIG